MSLFYLHWIGVEAFDILFHSLTLYPLWNFWYFQFVPFRHSVVCLRVCVVCTLNMRQISWFATLISVVPDALSLAPHTHKILNDFRFGVICLWLCRGCQCRTVFGLIATKARFSMNYKTTFSISMFSSIRCFFHRIHSRPRPPLPPPPMEKFRLHQLVADHYGTGQPNQTKRPTELIENAKEIFTNWISWTKTVIPLINETFRQSNQKATP